MMSDSDLSPAEWRFEELSSAIVAIYENCQNLADHGAFLASDGYQITEALGKALREAGVVVPD